MEKKELIVKISALIIGLLLKIGVVAFFYKFFGFEVAVLLLLLSIDSSTGFINGKIKEGGRLC